MAERNKITFRMVLDDFKKRHPHLCKRIIYWCPHDYATILIYIDDGMKLIYNWDKKKAYILSSRWK